VRAVVRARQVVQEDSSQIAFSVAGEGGLKLGERLSRRALRR
jgi:hypothetical protein